MSKVTNPWDYVAGFTKHSFGSNWPGKTTPVVFFRGCNFKCPTCHNASFAYGSAANIKRSSITKDVIFDYIKENRDWIDGVVISGGEAAIVPGFEQILIDFKNLDIAVKLDTNGFDIENIQYWMSSKLIEMLAIDIKGPYDKYPKLTGNAVTEAEAVYLINEAFYLYELFGNRVYYRTTKVPYLTTVDFLRIKDLIPNGAVHYFQNYIKVN